MILEVCVDSLTSARAAIAAGAHRLELCSALTVGGLSPYPELLEQIRQESAIPVRCLMRPRPGDFLYEPQELALMQRQMARLRDAGASGFVLGCLTPEGDLDEKALEPLIRAAGALPRTLHRAIDVSRDLSACYCQARELGFDTVLTSGGTPSCLQGQIALEQLLWLREELSGPEVLIGAGVNAQVIRTLRKTLPLARAFHMSGKEDRPSAMVFRREGIPMGVPGLEEWAIPQTSGQKVAEALAALA